ncbi:MAG: YfhO family protein [Oscillospiraceae bacterium]|nr:YfhO family protein [Candidatus Equicaccousia limihippi]
MSFSQSKKTLLKPQKEQYLRTFLLALLTASVIFVPFMIVDGGYFLFYGDFNVQQIPFYKLCHDAILSGKTAWDFGTDLGANFIGSYSFYTLGSPFFLFTLLFPSDFVPYLMGPLFILKFGCAALTAYCYIRRFTRTPDAAKIGALLYAFSGFSVYNIFFNHFHEAIILFPLLLLSVELLITENKRGFFAVMVGVCASLNYFFFFGIVVLTVIYWIVRTLSGCYGLTVKRFLTFAFEAVLGLGISAIMLLPSALSVMNNSRLIDLLYGWGAILYGKEQIYGYIIQSCFFPPDIPARPVFFPGADVPWSSVAVWLPLFSMVGVFATMRQKKGHWQRRLLGIMALMALVPFLNSAFYMFNNAYYARWFYMPILIMSLATVQRLEENDTDWQTPFRWTLGITIAIVLVIGLFPSALDGDFFHIFGLYNKDAEHVYFYRFLITSAIAVLSLVMLRLILPKIKTNFKAFCSLATVFILVITAGSGIYFVFCGKTHSFNTKTVLKDQLLESKFELPDSTNYRVDVYEGVDNTAMFLKLRTINAFQSVVPGSVTDFWKFVGEDRGVASRPSTESYAARSLLSVKYLLERDGKEPADETFSDDQGNVKMTGFTKTGHKDGYTVYRNENYIPYGFTYDYFVTTSQAQTVDAAQRSNLMVKAIVLDNDQAKKYDGILTNYKYKEMYDQKIAETPAAVEEPENKTESGTESETTQSEDLSSTESQNGEVQNTQSSQTSSTSSAATLTVSDIAKNEPIDYTVNNVLTTQFTPDMLAADAADRAATAGVYTEGKNGFSEKITLPRKNLVFFSVPYDEGWTATVNGKPAEIEKVNAGFMAVLCDEGVNDIVFTYTTPGLSNGIIITVISLAVLIIYLIIVFIINRKKREPVYPEGKLLLKQWEEDQKESEEQENTTEDLWDKIIATPIEQSAETEQNNDFDRGFFIDVDIDTDDTPTDGDK